MWFLIHPFAGFWRRQGPRITYLVVVAVALVIGVALFQLREPILRVEFGFSWPLTVMAVFCYAGGVLLEHYYRRQITIGVLFGLPEVSEKRSGRLLTEGIYGRIRHPRYLGLVFEISGFALLVNYLAVYVIAIAMVPVVLLIVLLEERELLARFGDDYAQYMRSVPRFFPKLDR